MPKAQSRVTAYKATDGRLFEDKAQYKEYQAALNVMGGLQQIGGRIEYQGDVDDRGNRVLYPKNFAQFVMNNAEDIQLALAGKPVPSRAERDAPAPEVEVQGATVGEVAPECRTEAMDELAELRSKELEELSAVNQALGLYDSTATTLAAPQ